jgi:geranylgeranyl reductase family protein
MPYDVIVVGSGPGGAVAAALLAQQRRSVLLADRQAFPRDKVCGDGLPIHVMTMLRDLGIDIYRAGLEFERIVSLSISAPNGKTLSTVEQATDVFSMTSRRYSFDHVLHTHAIRSGARFEQMHVHRPLIDRASGRVVGVVEKRGKDLIEHEARLVIAADGATSALARSLRGRVADADDTALGIRAYVGLKHPMPHTVYFYFTRDLIPGYAWIFPIANRRANIGIYLHNHQYRAQDNTLEAALHQFAADIQRKFPFEIEPDTVRSWSLPLWTDRHSRAVPGMLMVGDAGPFVNALTGGGIYPAMRTGRQAARRAVDILDGRAQESAYNAAWQQEVGGSLWRARLMQMYIASSAPIFNGIFTLAAIPLLRAPMLRAMSGEHY